MQNISFWAPSLHMGNGVLCYKERHTLLLKCFMTFLRCRRISGRASDSIWKPVMVNIVSFLLKMTLKFHVKCESLGTPFLRGNRMVCSKDSRPLLLKCLITFLIYIRMIRRASDSIYKSLHGQHHVITTKNNSQISCKISSFGYPLRTQNGMLCYKERHALLLEYSMTVLTYMRIIRGASYSICKHLMVHTVSLLPTTSILYDAKYHISGALSAKVIRGCDTGSDIHCCSSA